MIKKTIQEAINEQIMQELYAANLYLSMAMYFEYLNLSGCEHWMKKQWEEETGHARRLMDFLNDRSGRVYISGLEKPPVEFKSVLDVFEKALKHEQHVTELINELYALSVKEKDYQTQTFLQWFLTEQVEEEASLEEIIDRIKIGGQKEAGLLLIDQELGKRSE